MGNFSIKDTGNGGGERVIKDKLKGWERRAPGLRFGDGLSVPRPRPGQLACRAGAAQKARLRLLHRGQLLQHFRAEKVELGLLHLLLSLLPAAA